MYNIGIDIGYSSIKVVLLDSDHDIKYAKYVLHKGNIKEVLKDIFNELLEKYPSAEIKFGGATGSGSKFFSKNGGVEPVNEVAAIVEGTIKTNQNSGSIIEIGGESAKYITGFSGNDKSRIDISMNSNCSAGTGSFLEEQISRLNLKLEDYSIYAGRAKSIPRIAGRCSVFAKTDITHHQQEGVAIEDILLGLAYAVIKNYKGAVMKKLPMKKPILFVGGVAHNQGIITALKDVLKLNDEELIIPDNFSCISAVGAAMIAGTNQIEINLEKLLSGLEEQNKIYEEDESHITLPELKPFGNNDSLDKHVCESSNNNDNHLDCYLGVDVGSTSTNLVLMDENNEIVSYRYLKTLGDPVKAVRKGLKELKEELGERVNVIGACTTGSGRYMLGKLIGADVIKDEISAQAKAAVTIDPSVDTIFEIGGQDSKYISIEEGVVRDFQMNKICAAGTGSFIEEQSKKFNIPIHNFGEIALNSHHPIHLGERCTVFIETSIASYLSRGAKIENIASGLCYSIAKNYLDRVVGQKKVGNKIFFQGGVAYNQGVINAFRALTQKDIYVPPFFSVTGAYGAAILAKEEIGAEKTRFKGFDFEIEDEQGEENNVKKLQSGHESSYNKKVNEIIFEGYDGSLDDKKQTVGIPRALFTFGMFPMFNVIFKELGFNVLLSDPTNEATIRLAQEHSLDETCYPVKLINGHVAELVEKKVDYIFFPDLYNVDHPGSHTRQNYGCAYMQLAFKVVNQAMELEKKGIGLLAPTIAFGLGKEFMKESFSKLGKQLGKEPHEINLALQKGMKAVLDFEERLEENGKEVIKGLKSDEKVFVLISKIYGVADPVLNLGIPEKLKEMGYKAIPFYNLPEGDISKEYPNMFWPFDQHILEPAQLIKEHPNLYGIFLSHHGCGPDSVVSHYFREEMGGKPYLHIEVDEHSSGVGVMTRVEAFVNSLKEKETQKAEALEVYSNRVVHNKVNIKNDLNDLEAGTILYLPYMYPYSDIFKEILIQKGINAKVLSKTTKASVEAGRKFTITEEYFSLTALLGDIFKELNGLDDSQNNAAFIIPKTEGAEVEGQYNRFIRTKLDEEGFENVNIVAPFIEDVVYKDQEDIRLINLALLAGDMVRIAHKDHRKKHLDTILDFIKTNCFEITNLKRIAEEIREELEKIKDKKKVFAIGESQILYNDFLNNNTFKDIENDGNRVVYSPLSEAMWLLWRDYLDQNEYDNNNVDTLRQNLDVFKKDMNSISESLGHESPFEEELEHLKTTADATVGYYAGANGRYRASKILGDLEGMDGIITVASMYENTGIVLNILHERFEKSHSKPILNLTFDGNKNENDKTKIQSFMYYL